MLKYIFICHSDDDEFAHRIELNLASDRDALETAKDFAKDYAVDVWFGDTLLAEVKKRDEPRARSA